MPSPSDQSGRPVTPCPNCKTATVTAVILARNFVYLRCATCAHVFRRTVVRPEYQGRVFSW